MTQARLRTIEGIFYSALERAPGQVRAFLDTACQGDEILRSEVEALLAAYEPARGFIETSAIGLAAKVLDNTPADARTGLRMGHYELGELIGAGGMGEVYRATDILAGRKAALKLLPTRYTGDAERVDRFAQEARAVIGLNHPNILTIYEIGEQESTHYIASELIEGETLRQRLARGPMGAEEALEVAIQVASALHAAHQAGIVHRDIKPENIMLRPDGYVKVLDFGIAKLAQERVPISPGQEETIFLVETHLGAILGTARYMAPEQVRAAPVGKGADIWSLGVVLNEMLSERAPFLGETPQEVMHAILTTEPPPLTNVPSELRPIIERTLRKKSEERYPDAGELIKALKAARRSMELSAEREKLTLVTSPRPWTRPAVALSLGVIVIAFALAFYWQRNPATSPPPEKSVAVMPLVNTNGDPNNVHFSDGLSDELIAILAKIPGLKVIGRNSSFLFKGNSGDSADIGRKLGVAQLLEGSVEREGNRVRIVTSLIRASNGAELWSQTYDRNIKDIFAVQSEIAQAVAAQLKIELLGEKPASGSAHSNPKPAAHDDLLQAAFYAGQGNADGVHRAIQYAEEATQLDPTYAEAWAALAEYWRGYAVSDATGDEIDRAYAKARIAARQAFALDSNSVDALFAMYGMALTPDFDFRSAEKYARRAIELAPGNVTGLTALSSSLVAQGRLQEAEPIRREVTAIDPLQGGWYFHGLVLVGLHRYPEARAMFAKYLQMIPKAARVHTQFATLDILENNPKGALEHAHLEQEGIWRDFATAMALEASSDKPAAHAALQAFIKKYAQIASFQVAILYAQRRQPDEMFKWLETAYANRDAGLVRIFVIPFLVDYRDDPRFPAFCRKLGIESLPPKP